MAKSPSKKVAFGFLEGAFFVQYFMDKLFCNWPFCFWNFGRSDNTASAHGVKGVGVFGHVFFVIAVESRKNHIVRQERQIVVFKVAPIRGGMKQLMAK